MVESHFGTEKIEKRVGEGVHKGEQQLEFRKDPSFSGWYNEDGIPHSNHGLENMDANVEDFDFELSAIQQEGSESGSLYGEGILYSSIQKREMLMNDGNDTNDVSTHDGPNRHEKCVAFDIENESKRELNFSKFDANEPSCINAHEISQSKSRVSISIADVLKTLFFILVWYTFSTFLTLYNKTLLGDDLGKFPAPMLMNTIHFGMQAVLSKAITWYWSKKFQSVVSMSWRDYFVRVVPTALGTALDINLSNASLVFISVTFATMCKSAAPIFLLLFAFAFRLESPSFKLLGIMTIISVGILLTVAKEAEFEFWGFIFVMLAAVMSGFRWTMTQILLQKEDYGLRNPLVLMSHVTPLMTIATALLSFVLDPWYEFKRNNYFNNSRHIIRSSLLMLLGGTLAFFMVLTEYVLVSVTSAVTVTIAGVVKEAVTILVAVFYFHDEFTWLKGFGLFIIMVGVSIFNWYKYQKLRKGEKGEFDMAAVKIADGAKYVILEDKDDEADVP